MVSIAYNSLPWQWSPCFASFSLKMGMAQAFLPTSNDESLPHTEPQKNGDTEEY